MMKRLMLMKYLELDSSGEKRMIMLKYLEMDSSGDEEDDVDEIPRTGQLW